MRDLNKITITGRLGKDVEVKALANNRQVCNFTVASNRPQKDEAELAKPPRMVSYSGV